VYRLDIESSGIASGASERRVNKEISHLRDYGRCKKGGASEWKQDEKLIVLFSNQI
jgi:hypothetical protein